MHSALDNFESDSFAGIGTYFYHKAYSLASLAVSPGYLQPQCWPNGENAHLVVCNKYSPPTRFTTKRSLAQGIASSGSGIIGVVYSVSTVPMIERISLGWALRITGITSTAMLLIASLLMKDRYTSIRPDIHPFDTRLLKRKGVLLLCGYT